MPIYSYETKREKPDANELLESRIPGTGLSLVTSTVQKLN